MPQLPNLKLRGNNAAVQLDVQATVATLSAVTETFDSTGRHGVTPLDGRFLTPKRSFVLSYPVSNAATPVITLNGAPQTVGLSGTSGSNWYYFPGFTGISADAGDPTMPSGAVLTVAYTPQAQGTLPVAVFRDNTGTAGITIAANGADFGTTGNFFLYAPTGTAIEQNGDHPITLWFNSKAQIRLWGSSQAIEVLDGSGNPIFQVDRSGNVVILGGSLLSLDNPTPVIRGIISRTNGVNRWYMYTTADAESGSNAGSNWSLVAYADNGSGGTTVMGANRATKIVDFNQIPTVGGVALVLSSAAVTHTLGALTSGQLIVGNGSGDLKTGNLSGDVTTSGGTATTLKNTGPGAGTYTLAKLTAGGTTGSITLDAQGRVTGMVAAT